MKYKQIILIKGLIILLIQLFITKGFSQYKEYKISTKNDTIAVYGAGSNEIISYKIVKAEQYSVRQGEWRFYDPTSGRLIKTEVYDRDHLETKPDTTVVADDKPKPKVKPQEVIDFEKKNSGKKKVKLREGQTGL